MSTKNIQGALLELGKNQKFVETQKRRAAEIISQFMLVREGLSDRVPEDKLNEIATQLTLGIFVPDSR